MRALDRLRAIRRDPHVIAASLLANILGLAVPIGMIQIYDRVIPNAAIPTLMALGIGVGLALLADMALRLARSHLMALAGERFEKTAYTRVMAHILSEDPARAEAVTPGTLLNQVLGIERLRAFHTGDSAAALLDLPFVFLFLGLIALISPILAGTVLLMLATAFSIVHIMRRRIVALSIARQENDDRRQSFLIETLTGIEVVKSLGIEDFMERRYERLIGTAAPVSADLSRHIQMTQGVTGAIGLLAPLVTAATGATLVLNGQMGLGALAAVVLLTGRIVQPVLRIEALLVGEEDTERAQDDIQDVLSRPVRQSGDLRLPRVNSLALCDLSWRPAPDKPLVFDRTSLYLRRGECIAITGSEGSGRSSLLRLISGDVVPEAGKILFNRKPADMFRFEDRVEKVKLLSRQNRLLDGTLLDNMTDFQPARYLGEALELAAMLGLDPFIAQHPDGLGHSVGTSGAGRLPTSVNDSVLLVSSLVANPDVILFDEANAGLDQSADKRLHAWIKAQKPQKIIVLITHRPSYLALADRTYRLQGGKLRRNNALPPLNLGEVGARVA